MFHKTFNWYVISFHFPNSSLKDCYIILDREMWLWIDSRGRNKERRICYRICRRRYGFVEIYFEQVNEMQTNASIIYYDGYSHSTLGDQTNIHISCIYIVVIDDITCEERLWKMKRQHYTNFYLCEVSSNMVIDATNKGNKSRFIQSWARVCAALYNQKGVCTEKTTKSFPLCCWL